MWFGQVIHKLYLFIQQLGPGLGTPIGADWREERGVTNVIGEGKYFSFYQKIFRYFVYLALILSVSLTGWVGEVLSSSVPVSHVNTETGGESDSNFTFNKEGRTSTC